MVDPVIMSTDLHTLLDIDVGESAETCRAESASLVEPTRSQTKSLFLLAF